MRKDYIRFPARMKQLVSFTGMTIENKGNCYPTDIDGLIEYHDKGYVFFEVKHRNAAMPYGQRLALQRMVEDASRIGKTSIAIVCEHTVDNPLIPVTVATCRVREIYYSKEHRWRAPKYPAMTVRQAVDGFLYTPSVQQYRTPSGGISTLVVAQVARGGAIPFPPAYPAAQSYGAVPDTLRQSS